VYSKNKYGLKRYIPADIRTKIRKDAGFGCVICGCALVDYEHIEPEFHQAKEHNPEKMTLLCISCHGRVTRKIISKAAVWEAKETPKALQAGYVHDLMFTNTEDMEIKIGNSSSKNTKIVLTMNGKPVIWFEPPIENGEPYKLCAIFYGDDGKPISYVNRNQFIAFSSNQDVKSESTKLFITSNGINCLTIDRKGGEILHITKIQIKYLDASVITDSQDRLIMQHGETKIIGGVHIDNCGSAITVGIIPYVRKYRKLPLAIFLARNKGTGEIINLTHNVVGWVIDNELFNTRYELVGFTREGRVYNIIEEYIGNLVGRYIAHTDNCYENGEPIYISKENMAFRAKNPQIGYDLSFRLFEGSI